MATASSSHFRFLTGLAALSLFAASVDAAIIFSSTQTGAQLLANPNVSFPNGAPTSSGTSIDFNGLPNNSIQMDWELLPAASRGDLKITVVVDYERLTADSDIKFVIGDGSRAQGVLRADNSTGQFYSTDATHTATTITHSISLLGSGFDPLGEFQFQIDAPDGGAGPTVLSNIVEGSDSLSGPFNLATNPINTDNALSFLIGADSNGNSPFRLNSVSITIEDDSVVPEPSTYFVFGGLALCFGLAGWWRKRRKVA